MNYAENARARATSKSLKKHIEDANKPLVPPTSDGAAQVIPFPAPRSSTVRYALLRAEGEELRHAYREFSSITNRHRNQLERLGVAPDLIEADIAAMIDGFGIGGDEPASPAVTGHADRDTDLIA